MNRFLVALTVALALPTVALAAKPTEPPKKEAPAPAAPAPAPEPARAPEATFVPVPVPLPPPAAAAPSGAGARRAPKLLVLDFAASGVTPVEAANVGRVITSEVARASGGETVGREDVAALIGNEQLKQVLGCTGPQCGDAMSDIASMVEAELVLSGSVGKVGRLYLFAATVLESKRGRSRSRVVRKVESLEEIIAAAPGIAQELLAMPATLLLSNQYPGARVLLDNEPLGVMPVDVLAIRTPGRHRVRVEHADCVPWETDAEFEAGQPLRLRADLARVAEIESRANLRRVGGATVLATALGLAAGAFVALRQASTVDARYDAVDLTTVSQAELDGMAADATLSRTIGFALAGLSAVGLGTGTWLLANNPHADRLAEAAGR